MVTVLVFLAAEAIVLGCVSEISLPSAPVLAIQAFVAEARLFTRGRLSTADDEPFIELMQASAASMQGDLFGFSLPTLIGTGAIALTVASRSMVRSIHA
ncbi:MAG: hypothetical protein KME20_26920 [Kaiparowitsia implicata GSE-PSE-MK54-09C]|nr:hypothetical protein [Kaiparowitsia implicata GSE-PSE-MK54-09C]